MSTATDSTTNGSATNGSATSGSAPTAGTSATAAATATVRLPTVLRPQAGGATTVEIAGATVGEIITNLVAAYPGLESSLLDDDGNVRKFVNLYVDDEDVRFAEGLDTVVAAGDEVAILPAVAGG